MRQRAVAGAEVVDRDPHPDPAQPLQDAGRGRGVRHPAGLGDLQHERAAGQAVPLQGGADGPLQARVAEPGRGHVHVHRQAAAGRGAQADEVPAGPVQHPVVEVGDEAGALGDRHEHVGRHRPAARVGPPGQRLHRDGAAVGEAHDRLVVHPQPAVGRLGDEAASQGTGEPGRQVGVRAGRGVPRPVRHHRPAACRFASYIAASAWCSSRPGVSSGAPGVRDHHPDAGPHRARAPEKLERLVQGRKTPARRPGHPGRRRPPAGPRTRPRPAARRCRPPGRARSRPATSRSSSSPVACPKLSLTALKSSRSQNSSASGWPSRRCTCTACASRSPNSDRFATPVSGSWKAWWASCRWPSRTCRSSCMFSRSVISCRITTRPTTSVPT